MYRFSTERWRPAKENSCSIYRNTTITIKLVYMAPKDRFFCCCDYV